MHNRTRAPKRGEASHSAGEATALSPSASVEGVPAPLHTWLAMPMEPSARSTIERVRRADDVVHVAVMPDVHLANDVCVGTVMATRRLVYPSAVGGDIGCGMLAIGFDSDATALRNPANAGLLLRALTEAVPIHRRHRSRTMPLPDVLRQDRLSHGALTGTLQDSGVLQMGTLGGGNHFIELQADASDRLWLMIHSGSRAMGQAVKAHHLARATLRSASMMALDIETTAGQAYLHDQHWARAYAHANRQAMGGLVVDLLRERFKINAARGLTIGCDHNHVQREEHLGQPMLVHRKGAMPAATGQAGIVPGSMGTLSYHVTGRGCALSLRSSAHGAGRLLSRHAARERFNRRDLRRQMGEVWFDPRIADSLREESPKSYKDVRAVLAAQEELVRVDRVLKPVLVYKGCG
jgi:tRNA-splicing ligase RtcB